MPIFIGLIYWTKRQFPDLYCSLDKIFVEEKLPFLWSIFENDKQTVTFVPDSVCSSVGRAADS